MKKFLLGITFFAFILSGCAGSGSGNAEDLDAALAGFASCVQSGRWQEALEYVSEDESSEISPDGYEFKDEYKTASRRLQYSTLRTNGQLSVDRKGRLVGIKQVMDEANERYVVSEEQAKVGTNLEEMEKEHIRRRLEEGQKAMQENENAVNQEQQVEVMSNKLTEEEKRKYGSTRDLQAPEQYQDAETEAAEEEIHGDYESE